MTDFHTHILPELDDGSRSVDESIEMLRLMKQQGISTVCATPHFYSDEDVPESFFENRRIAYEKLRTVIENEQLPQILLGAELAYYPGVSKMSRLADFKIEGSKLILLEMPMITWSDYMVSELIDISCSGDMTVVLAHVERYRFEQTKAVWTRLLKSGVLMQMNASYFTNTKTRRKAFKQLKRGEIHLLGSDCHNMISRTPRLYEAFELIGDKFGKDYAEEIQKFGERMLVNAIKTQKNKILFQ